MGASATAIEQSLLKTAQLRQWMFPQQLPSSLPDTLAAGLVFTSHLGAIPIQHRVELLQAGRVRMLLSQGIDGYHEWSWGDGWVQSRLEGVSLLPLNLGQTFALLRLRSHLQSQTASPVR